MKLWKTNLNHNSWKDLWYHTRATGGAFFQFFLIFYWIFCSKMNCRVQTTTVTILSMHLKYQNKHLRIKHQIGLRIIPGTASTSVEHGITSLSTTSCTKKHSGGTASIGSHQSVTSSSTAYFTQKQSGGTTLL